MDCIKSQKLANRNLIVDFLSILFGIGSWIGVTSAYIQLPLLVSTAPEGWSLPSYMAITVQSANIGSFAYVLYQKYSCRKCNDSYLIYFTMVVGCVAAICMTLFYQYTTEIDGKERSVSFLIFTFMFALVGCLSSVLFMPYMGRFREIYLVTYLCGQGLNGFLSSILALIQGVGGNPECIPNNSTIGPPFIKYIPPPLFGPKIYFAFVAVIMLMSFIAFILLNNLELAKKEHAAGTVADGNEYHYEFSEKTKDNFGAIPDNVKNLSVFNKTYLMGSVFVTCFLVNGVLPGIQSYACLPYGSKTYHFAVTLAAVANPLACFIAMFMPHTSIRNIRILSFGAVVLATYIIYVAVHSPYPPLVETFIGKLLIVICLSSFSGFCSYMKLSITTIFRYQEGKSLVWVGTMAQISSCMGAILMFSLVNNTNIFVSYEPC